MKTYTLRTTSKAGMLLAHMERTKLQSIWGGDVAVVMNVQRKQVPSLCGHLVRKGYLRMVWERDGQHYVRPAGLSVLIDEPWIVLNLMEEADAARGKPDWEAEFLEVRRTCVSAAGLPPPYTTAARSVFDLAGTL